MTRILVFNVPTQGHINPMLPVMQELVERGVEVICYLTPAYRSAVEAMGATFRPYSRLTDDYFESRGLDGSNPPKSALTLIKTAQEFMPELLQVVHELQPDIILHDSMCPWGWMLAKAAHIPSVSSMSLFMFDAILMIRAGILPSLLKTVIPNLSKIRQFNQVAARIERQYHIKNPGFAQFLNATGTITINYTSKMIQPNGEKMPDSIKFVGPSIKPRTAKSDFPFDQLTGQPLIYISLGTVINQNQEFYRNCFRAFASTPYQVVMSVGKNTDIASLGDIPANFIVRNFVPQLDILQRASLFITHSGMNSVHEGLYYNVPLLLVPQQTEQRFVALRIQSLGAGLMLSSTTPSIQEFQTNAQKILHDPQFKQQAFKIGESLRQAGGGRRAADEILRLVKIQKSG